MVIIRNSMIGKWSCVLAVAAMASLDAAPAQAQQYAGTRNSRQGTLGDIDAKKLNAQIEKLPGLNFRPIGLFGDAGFDDPFRPFEQPSLFIYNLPNFAGAGLNFNGLTYFEYLDTVAGSYGIADRSVYQNAFLFSNRFSVSNQANFFQNYDDLAAAQNLFFTDFARFRATFGFDPTTLARYLTNPFELTNDLNNAAFNRAHQEDFLAGGGFFPLPGGPVTPKPKEPPVFDPFPTDDPADDTNTDTSAATLLEDSGILTDTELADALDLIEQASASQSAPESAPVVSAVPEPATLGLLVVAGTAMIGRRRR